MANQSTIDALRRLAERPGTEHEGIVAREMLRRLETKLTATSGDFEAEWTAAYRAFARKEIGIDAFCAAMRKHTEHVVASLPESWKCACGATVPRGEKCGDQYQHLSFQTSIRTRFHKGDRVFYNMHAYPENDPGIVAAYVKLKPENGTYPWAWISVRFDRLKGARQIPVVSDRGWHLSREPVSHEAHTRLSLPEWMWLDEPQEPFDDATKRGGNVVRERGNAG